MRLAPPFTPMNEKYKQPWIDALRSGTYKQTRSALKDSYGYCCLGVLCDVASKMDPETVKAPTPWGYKHTDDTAFSDVMPTWALDNLFGIHGVSGTLAEMNDGPDPGDVPEPGESLPARKTFAEIADWIEANL